MMLNHHWQINTDGHLEIGDIDTTHLVKKYGTPLYVYDVSVIRENCRAFLRAFKNLSVRAQVAYASKVFSSMAIVEVIQQENLNLDVVSTGELYTALKAGFPPEKIHLHGNNKSIEELEMAIKHDIGCIVIDNFYEINLLDNLLRKYEKKIDVLMRVTPGVTLNTHQYIITGSEDSKFGFNLTNGQSERAFQQLRHHPYMNFKGLHCHIGSQIFSVKHYEMTANLLFKQISNWYKHYKYIPDVLNLGGGFGIRYTSKDSPTPYETFIEKIVQTVQRHVKELDIPMPEIWIEPGRAIVGNAGITLYTIGSMKDIPNVRSYIAVDGGMTDNIRPALYNASYEGVIANKANEPKIAEASIAGKCCESGDMLIWDLPVPEVEAGDILAVFATGAYGYSMANHYNRFPRPAVVFVENGKDTLVIKRETYKDVVKNDLSYIQTLRAKPFKHSPDMIK